MRFGWPHRHYRRVDSTNARARELAGAGAPGGTVVTAEEQTAGRGRQGRTWTAPGGKALLYSAILRPLGDRPLLPLAVALAACEAAEDLAPGARCRIKWPNDVWIGERKLAGVLIETRTQSRDPAQATGERREGWAVVGVGLNLTVEAHEFPAELRRPATSLAIAAAESGRTTADFSPASSSPASPSPRGARLAVPAGQHLSPRRARVALDASLGEWIAAPDDRVLAAYRERDALHGREVAWSAGSDLDAVSGSGVAAGIDDRGGLVVRLPGGGSTVLFAGEVHLRL